VKVDIFHLNFLRCPGDLWPGAFDGLPDPSLGRLIRMGRSWLERLRASREKLVVVSAREQPWFFSQKSGYASAAGAFVRGFLKDPTEIIQMLLFLEVVRRRIPVALINRSDDGRLLTGSDWFYRRCHACFVRELHPLPEIALRDLYTPSGGNPQTNRRARRILSWFDPSCPTRRDISKLRPISLGVRNETLECLRGATGKKWDLFFAGDLHEKGLRGRMIEELRELAGKRVWKILLRDRLPQEEYLYCLAQSRLCLSPPGMGWDCWRHYEAMLAESVPVMPYPTILQYQPALDGEHCFYFAPESGGLTLCLQRIMTQMDRLPAMAQAGRRLVLENHTYSKLREYVIRETLEAHARSKD